MSAKVADAPLVDALASRTKKPAVTQMAVVKETTDFNFFDNMMFLPFNYGVCLLESSSGL